MRRTRPALPEKSGGVMSLPGLGGAAHNGGIPSSSRPTTTGMRPRQQQSMFPEAETGSARRTRSKAAAYISVGVMVATMGGMGIWGRTAHDERFTPPKEERSPATPTSPATVATEPEHVDTRHPRLDLRSDGVLRAEEAGLTNEEIEQARQVAIKTVREALLKPGGLPPSSSPKFPDACNVLVEGFPFVGSKNQRCCKVNTTNPLYIRSKMMEAEAARTGDGKLFEEEEEEDGEEGMPAEMDTQSAVREESGARRGRRLEEEEGGGSGKGGLELPGVLRTERRVDDDGKEVVCFPSFIIAGTQKSGTTALTGILEQHPQVRMSARKELHYFDQIPASPSTNGAENYAYHFASFNASLAMQHRAPFIVGEATPFYLASRTACAAMRKQLPGVRLLVLVREPVKRAYSEYQMKVRRVEEQEEMLKLLARDANKVYDCLHEAFPSVGDGFTPSEGELLWNPLKFSNVVGQCAGEVGAHGKWMDVMLAFVKRVRMRIKGSTEKDVLAGRGPVRLALKGLRNDVNRCFPLKKLAAAAEVHYPGGTWRAQWNKMGQGTMPRGRPDPFRAGGVFHEKRAAGRGFPGWGGGVRRTVPSQGIGGRGAGGGRRLDSKEDVDYQWFVDGDVAGYEEFKPYSIRRRWNETITAAAASATQQQWRLFQDEGDALEGHGQLLESYDEDGVAVAPFVEHFGEQYGAYDLDYEGYEDEPDLATLEEEAQKHTSDSGSLGDDGASSTHLQTFRDEEGELHRVFTRSRRKLGDGMPMPGMAGGTIPLTAAGEWRELDWGEWGQKGEREYDDTCYMKMEKLQQADTVMRQEIKQLTTCFDKALAPYGGLAAMEEVEARVAAKALDERIEKCMKVSPGISNQYLYRSLYSVQAFHCLRHFPRDQVMFIESDDLRANAQKVLTEVHKFIGVPDYSYQSLEQESIMQELNNKYPDFQKRTGWRLDSKYEEMPQELARDVRAFLKPHMGVFARLAGQSFGDWAVDTADGKEAMLGTEIAADILLATELQKEIEKLIAAKNRRRTSCAYC